MKTVNASCRIARRTSSIQWLAPGRSVGEHATGHHEELATVLQGRGEMMFGNGSKLKLQANQAI